MKKIVSVMLMVAIMLSVCVFTGCENSGEEGGITTITWYIPGVLEGTDVGVVMDKVNELLAERYGLNLELICVDNKNYSSKMQVINAGREEYDLLYVKDFGDSMKNGVLYDITDLLPEIAPTTYEALDDANWEAVTVDGRIYGVPNWQVQAYATGVMGNKAKYDAAGVDIKDIKTTEDMTAYLEKIHAIEPETNIIDPWWTSMTIYYGFEEVIDNKMVGAIRFNEEGKPTAINQYETEEFKEYINVRRDWVERGLVADYYENNHNAEKKEVQRLPMGVFYYKPSLASEKTLSSGYPYVGEPISQGLLTGRGIRATMTGVSTTSKHPDKALKMIEIIYSDPEIYNLLCWGIEGTHYTKDETGKITIAEGSNYDRISNWKIGPVYNSLLLSNQEDDVNDKTKEFNEAAVVSPLMGFIFDTAPVSSQLSNCLTVINKELQSLEMGLVEPEEGLQSFLNNLDVAGAQDIIDELQKQIDEWWAKNK